MPTCQHAKPPSHRVQGYLFKSPSTPSQRPVKTLYSIKLFPQTSPESKLSPSLSLSIQISIQLSIQLSVQLSVYIYIYLSPSFSTHLVQHQPWGPSALTISQPLCCLKIFSPQHLTHLPLAQHRDLGLCLGVVVEIPLHLHLRPRRGIIVAALE